MHRFDDSSTLFFFFMTTLLYLDMCDWLLAMDRDCIKDWSLCNEVRHIGSVTIMMTEDRLTLLLNVVKSLFEWSFVILAALVWVKVYVVEALEQRVNPFSVDLNVVLLHLRQVASYYHISLLVTSPQIVVHHELHLSAVSPSLATEGTYGGLDAH